MRLRVSRVVSLRVPSSIRRRRVEVIQYNVTYRYKLVSNVGTKDILHSTSYRCPKARTG